jgi:aldehyde:ferredoxin oxidoreductase
MASSMFDVLVRIDCTAKTAVREPVGPVLKAYIGGMGYGTKLLVDEVAPTVDPLSEKNRIVLTTGPLTGTAAPMFPQACIVTKSPLSGTILNCYAGGFLGAEIKFCGIDGLIIEGKAPGWVLILVEDGAVSFHDASPVMGKGTAETEAYMKKKWGAEARTLSIGRAGEKAVAMAAIFSETRTFGRGGAGAVLGSKRIKGMAFKGTHALDVADRAAFADLVARNMEVIRKACAEEHNLVGMFSRVGTGAGMGLVNSKGGMATRNHEYGVFPEGREIDGWAYAKKYYTRAISCYGCPVHCGMLHKFRKRDTTESWLRGPEYETMFSLGSEVMNADPVTLAEANQLCEDYGMDTLTVGVTIAWALEMGEKGILKDPDLSMAFGDSDSILGLITKIGEREGIGDLLADGPKVAAERTGRGSIGAAMQVKNSGFAAWMPRRMKGVALAFATSNRGACHKRAPIGDEIMGKLDMDSYEGKAPIVRGIQDFVNAIFTFVACRFHEFITPKEMYTAFLEAATGQRHTLESFTEVGERIWNLERLFNIGAGFSRADDTLPDRCFEPIKGEASQGAVITREKFSTMLDEYYAVRGWTRDGVPTPATLKRLGIETEAAALLGGRKRG